MRRTPIAHLALTASLALAPVCLVAVAAGPAHAAATCDGRAATIVGPGTRTPVTGTEGPDVIVSNNASSVDARGGDDTVCVTGVVSDDGRSVRVDDGAGDDVVLDEATYVDDPSEDAELTTFVVDLGEGGDRFVGNDTPEVVVGRSGNDTIETRGGADRVVVGESRVTPGRPLFGGRVDVGTGVNESESDQVVVGVQLASTTTVATDDPRALLLPSDDYAQDGAWQIDAAGGGVLLDGALKLRTSGFARFAWGLHKVVSFRGTPGADFLAADSLRDARFGEGDDEVTASIFGGGVVSLGGGDDGALLDGLASAVRVDGGTGADVISVVGCRVSISSGAGADDVTARIRGLLDLGRCPRTPATSLELRLGAGDDQSSTAGFTRSRVVGGSGADEITAGGRVVAGAGDDRVFGRAKADRIDGGAGDDVLVGGRGADTLRGGPGRDVTRGGAGRDLCRAERRTACER